MAVLPGLCREVSTWDDEPAGVKGALCHPRGNNQDVQVSTRTRCLAPDLSVEGTALQAVLAAARGSGTICHGSIFLQGVEPPSDQVRFR